MESVEERTQSLKWAFVVVRADVDGDLEGTRIHIQRTPTLLSLDGGGMRGLISAQVLRQLEDSLKQVLWKERLLKVEVVRALLAHAARRKVITEEEHENLLRDYIKQVPADPKANAKAVLDDLPKPDAGDAAFQAFWRSYCSRQKAVLAPPHNWGHVKKCFDLDIADFFDQLAGTSTGGLLALYLAARGGRLARANDDTLRSRPGSAAGASDFYMDNGAAIFDTSEGRKLGRFLASAGQYRHEAAGLEGVLRNVFDDMTLQDLETYGANLVVTTVDVVHKRTAFFFHTSGKPPPAYTGPDMGGEGTNGLATPLRKDDHRNLVLVRDSSRPPGPPVYCDAEAARDAAQEARARQATGWLSPMIYYGDEAVPSGLEGFMGTNRNDVRYITATGGWVAPMSFDEYNFKLVDVARATSAAPVFLPPKQIRPVLSEGAAVPEDWRYRVFVDGGLANNDPTFMGLAQLLQRNNKAGLKDCAILSIGTGTKASFDGYDAPVPKQRNWLGRLGSALGTVALSPVRLLNLLSLGWAKRLVNIPKSILHVGGLVGLTMDTNGEDKENMFRLIYYGLLRAPEGTYLRIQIKDESRDYRRLQEPQEAQGDGNGVAAVRGFDWEELPQEAKQAWRDALGNMDDPRPHVLTAYREMGEMMAARFALRLTWWVRCFVFGLEEAAKNPFVLLPELKGLSNGKEAQGGRFLAKSIREDPDAIW